MRLNLPDAYLQISSVAKGEAYLANRHNEMRALGSRGANAAVAYQSNRSPGHSCRVHPKQNRSKAAVKSKMVTDDAGRGG
jgi:hypothetical protein